MLSPQKNENYSKEDLLIFLKNDKARIGKLRIKLELLTGCYKFGDIDGTDGSCVECSYNNPTLWNRCASFYEAYKDYKERIVENG